MKQSLVPRESEENVLSIAERLLALSDAYLF
jgi:hypothetical protein